MKVIYRQLIDNSAAVRKSALRHLMTSAGLNLDAAQRVLSNPGIILKRGLDEEKSRQFAAQLRKMGLICEIKGEESSAVVESQISRNIPSAAGNQRKPQENTAAGPMTTNVQESSKSHSWLRTIIKHTSLLIIAFLILGARIYLGMQILEFVFIGYFVAVIAFHRKSAAAIFYFMIIAGLIGYAYTESGTMLLTRIYASLARDRYAGSPNATGLMRRDYRVRPLMTQDKAIEWMERVTANLSQQEMALLPEA